MLRHGFVYGSGGGLGGCRCGVLFDDLVGCWIGRSGVLALEGLMSCSML